MKLTPLVAHAEVARWRYQRLQVAVLGASERFPPNASKRVLLITHANRIAQSQIFPFFLYRRPLARRYGVALREVGIDTFEKSPALGESADIVLLQTWFDYEHDRIRRICELIRRFVKPTRMVFLDSFAHTDLRLASVLNEYVDLYVKKHLFRDRSTFEAPTRGDTNLTDYFGRRYGLSYPEVRWPIPGGFIDKLVLGPGFVAAPELLPGLCADTPPRSARPIDVHSRLGFNGADWYQSMRREALETVTRLPGATVLLAADVPHGQYLRELKKSKLCYSPFGYGEIAWRDAEAVACGALLLKPDMSHLETDPDTFIPYETYVPLKWDYSDTTTEMQKYLRDAAARERMTGRAHAIARDYLQQERFVEQMRRLFV